MEMTTSEALTALKQMKEQSDSEAGVTSEIDQNQHRLLQAGYQFHDPSDDDGMDETYELRWGILRAAFERKKFPHAILRIHCLERDHHTVMLGIVAEEGCWEQVLASHPHLGLSPAPSALHRLIEEEQTEDFSYDIQFRHVQS